jgi:hypothetical protein
MRPVGGGRECGLDTSILVYVNVCSLVMEPYGNDGFDSVIVMISAKSRWDDFPILRQMNEALLHHTRWHIQVVILLECPII